MVKQAVEDGRGQRGIIVEDRRPVLVRLVGSQHDGAALVAFAEDLKEQVGAKFVDRKIAEFVDDEQGRTFVPAQFLPQALAGMRG